MIGTRKDRIRMPDASFKVIALHGSEYVADITPLNLFSLSQALSGGCSLGNNGDIITFIKKDFALAFYQQVHTNTRYVATVEVASLEDNEVAAPTLVSNTIIDVHKFLWWSKSFLLLYSRRSKLYSECAYNIGTGMASKGPLKKKKAERGNPVRVPLDDQKES